jgi:hypothetical protein
VNDRNAVLKNDCIVARVSVAVCNSDILASHHFDAVGIEVIQRVADSNAVHFHVVAGHQIACPERISLTIARADRYRAD